MTTALLLVTWFMTSVRLIVFDDNADEALKENIQQNFITKRMMIKDDDIDDVHGDDDETPKSFVQNYWLGKSDGSFSKSCL